MRPVRRIEPGPGQESVWDDPRPPRGRRCAGERVEPQPGGFYGGWVTHDVVGPFKGGPGPGLVSPAPPQVSACVRGHRAQDPPHAPVPDAQLCSSGSGAPAVHGVASWAARAASSASSASA